MYKFVTYSSLFSQLQSSSNVENLSPAVIQKLTKELMQLQQEPPEGIKIFVNEEDVTNIEASIEGPGEYYS